uniref:gamma-glutamylcyclotransferase n=1 Tax=Ditylum brightwellii TaxID=49249 RepID=A0A6U3TKC6_9STRA|mmetsp:Transcript_38418/g.57579  ORF Transcript_38418/g.57579 Transcript_38418/m.57579 type:complete len:338 (+) Transcript_38418:30-1043(+)
MIVPFLPHLPFILCFLTVLKSATLVAGGLTSNTPTVADSIKAKSKTKVNNHPVRPQLVKDALETNSPIYYFGIGSNMSRSKLENRSVCGSQIHIQQMEAATVPGYRLAFNLRGFPPLEPGMGSLEPRVADGDDGSALSYDANECHGALIKLSADDYEKVMRSEGVAATDGNPNQTYDEIVVTAIPYNKNHPPVQAVALRARSHARLKKDPCPSPRYMNILREGARELGLKPCYQEFLNKHPVQTNSPLLRKIAIANLVLTVTLSYRFKIRQISKLQSWLLFKVYAPTTASKAMKILSEIASVMILLPGSIIGFFLLKMLLSTGKMPPMMKEMVEQHW